MEKYRKGQVLGQGSFGKAIKVRNVHDGKDYVIKEIDISRMPRGERQAAELEAKVSLHRSPPRGRVPRHPSLVTAPRSGSWMQPPFSRGMTVPFITRSLRDFISGARLRARKCPECDAQPWATPPPFSRPQVLLSLGHPNIVSCVESFTHQGKVSGGETPIDLPTGPCGA